MRIVLTNNSQTPSNTTLIRLTDLLIELHPKVLSLTLDPKLTYNAHIHNIATHAQKPLQVIKALTGTTWGKQKETLVATYKAIMSLTLEYASSIWSPMASPTSINKLQVMQNAALRACTGCTHDTSIQHLHDKTNILPIQKHLQLHASQVRQKAQYPSHPLYRYTTHNTSQRLKKPTTSDIPQTSPQTHTLSLQQT